jgi:hypothetical protein
MGKIVVSQKLNNSNKRGRPKQGQIWIVSKEVKEVNNILINFLNERISSCTIGRTTIYGVYMPSDNLANGAYDTEMRRLGDMMKRNSESIAIGDFNADVWRSHKYTRQQYLTNYEYRNEKAKQKCYHNDKYLSKWTADNNFACMSQLFTQKVPYTFLNMSGSYSFIDHIVASPNNAQILNVNIITTKEESEEINKATNENKNSTFSSCWDDRNLSDHRPIMLEIKVSRQKIKPMKVSKHKLNWLNPKQKEACIASLRSNLEKSSIEKDLGKINAYMSHDSITLEGQKAINELNNLLIKTENDAIKVIYPEKADRWLKSKSWYTDEMHVLTTRRKKLRFVWLETRTEAIRQELCEIRKKFRALKKASKKNLGDKLREKLREKYTTCRIAYWIELNRRKTKTQSVCINEAVLVSHFKDLFASKSSNIVNKEFDSEVKAKVNSEIERIKQKEDYKPISPLQICDIMKKLPNGKSPGPNKVKNELYKFAVSTRVVHIVAKIFEIIFSRKIMPDNMNEGLIIPIIKDVYESNEDTKNIRGITLSDTMSTIFEQLILTSFNKRSTLEQQQYGFKNK